MSIQRTLSPLIISLFIAAPALAAGPIATVNGKAIPAIQGEVIRADMQARGRQPAEITDELVREALVNMEVIYQAAVARGIEKPELVQALLELERKERVIKLLQDDFIKSNPIPEETIKAEYDRAKARAGDTEYQVRHILVDDEALARKLIAQMAGSKRVKFEDLAKKNSKDSTAAQGGDLGWMRPGKLVPEFADAMVKLKKGQMTTTPVRSRFGWHIIKLEDTRPIDFPKLEDVREQIIGQLMQAAYRKYVADLRSQAKVEVPAAK